MRGNRAIESTCQVWGVAYDEKVPSPHNWYGTVTVRYEKVEKIDHMARVSLDCGFPVQALITEYSVDSLKVVPGERFYVTFKASAIRLY